MRYTESINVSSTHSPTLMEQHEEAYQQLIVTAREDSGVVGLILGGSRGKGIPTTAASDYDISIIAQNEVIEGVTIKYKALSSPTGLDISCMSEQGLSMYGVWGSDTMWARYGFAHTKAVIDKTRRLQAWIDEQEFIPEPAKSDAIKQSLDGYLNYTHRSFKSLRDRRTPAAHLASCDAMPLLITFLFAVEGRVRPYNEYIEWELGVHPLENLRAIPPAVFMKKISTVLVSGDEATQKELYALVREVANRNDIGKKVLASWDGYYFG